MISKAWPHPNVVVVDASVGGKWLLKIDEAHRDEALELLKKHIEGEEQISVPDLFFYEVSNALATKTRITPQKIIPLLKKLFETRLLIYHPTEKDLINSTKLAKKHQVSVYDMLYAVIAKENKTTLYTADENFVKKTGFRFVKHISEVRLTESS